MSDTRYLTKISDTRYYYNPPAKAVEAGTVKRRYFNTHADAVAYTEEQNKLLDEWSSVLRHIKKLSTDSRVKHLLLSYYSSHDFIVLADSTKEQYRFYLNAWLTRKVAGVVLENAKLSMLTTPMVQRLYESELSSSVWTANEVLDRMRMLFNYGIRLGYINFNPFSQVKKKSVGKRKTMWSREYVRAFLNIAFSKWEWRNAGVIFYIMYETAQRSSDVIKLKWEDINFDKAYFTVKQSKRGATVKIPISAGLLNILKQQHVDFGMQSFVAPRMVRYQGKWCHYSIQTINNIFKRIKEEAGVPEHLQMRDLRRTALTETLEGGADAVTLMQLSGHQSIASLNPYIVHTLAGATKAQEVRQFPDKIVDNAIALRPRRPFQRLSATL